MTAFKQAKEDAAILLSLSWIVVSFVALLGLSAFLAVDFFFFADPASHVERNLVIQQNVLAEKLKLGSETNLLESLNSDFDNGKLKDFSLSKGGVELLSRMAITKPIRMDFDRPETWRWSVMVQDSGYTLTVHSTKDAPINLLNFLQYDSYVINPFLAALAAWTAICAATYLLILLALNLYHFRRFSIAG